MDIRKAEALIRSMDTTIIMARHSSVLDGKNVGVIGYNARPIAASLRRQGALTYVSDYWGDSDLAEVSTDCIAVLAPTAGIRQRQPLDLPMHQTLIDNFAFLTKDVELDSVIIGSGFDDNSESLNDLHKGGFLTGSPPSIMKRSRDFELLIELVTITSCKIPIRQIYPSGEDLLAEIDSLNFPCLLRPSHSGGGSGIRFVRHPGDLRRIINLKSEESTPLVIQEYLHGRDLSCSVLSTGTESRAISVQGQLIGVPSAGRNCDFTYCGNFIPSGLDPSIERKIMKVSEQLSVKLGLKGSIGFDFVIDGSDNIWLMEVNPRIQGTLEMLEIAGNISITEQHVRSSNQELYDETPTFTPSTKMIVYSRKDGIVPDLQSFSGTFDKSPEGVYVNQGDPICTVIETGVDLLDAYRKTFDTVSEIQHLTKPRGLKTGA